MAERRRLKCILKKYPAVIQYEQHSIIHNNIPTPSAAAAAAARRDTGEKRETNDWSIREWTNEIIKIQVLKTHTFLVRCLVIQW